jgi:hypothetical protein
MLPPAAAHMSYEYNFVLILMVFDVDSTFAMDQILRLFILLPAELFNEAPNYSYCMS